MNKSKIRKNIKRILLFIAGLITILILVLLVNTISLKSKQTQIVSIPKVNINDNVLTHFSKAIQYRTISYEDSLKFDSVPFLEFCDFLKQTYPLTDTHLKRHLINKYNILYKWEGNDTKINPIILTAHYDVVPVEESSSHEWINDPYSGEIDTGFVWGRG